MKLSTLCHTNSEYFDVANLFVKRYRKFCNIELLFLTDIQFENEKCIIYNNKESYKDRWIKCLKSIMCDNILFLHEDFILTNKVEIPEININFDFIRLQKNGINNLIHIKDNLYKVTENYFSITPTIWKKDKLLNFFQNSKHNTIWDLEIYEQQNAKRFNGFFLYDKEPLKGLYHHDSRFYPCILSAINKGKWNYSEYKNEFLDLIKEFNIDLTIRDLI